MNFVLPVGKHRWWKGGCACGSAQSVDIFQHEVCVYKLNLILKEQGYKIVRLDDSNGN